MSSTGPESTRFDSRALLVLMLLYAAVYAAWYPRTFSILDEQAFLSFGTALSRGTVYADVAGVDAARAIEIDGHRAPRVSLGMPALLAPIVAVDWRGGFLVALALHLIGTWACAAMLGALGLRPIFAALYLFHPVAALYTRTVMSDIPTMALTTVTLWLLVRTHSRPLLAGLVIGLTPHLRGSQLVVIAGLGLAFALRDLARSREHGWAALTPSLWLAAGVLPGVLGWMAVNAAIYGGPFETPVTWPLSVEHIPRNLPRYLVSQNLVYPLGLVIGLLYPSRLRAAAALVAVGLLGLYGTFLHLYEGFGTLTSLIVGDRFFLPLFPLLLPGYAGALTALLARAGQRGPPLLALGVAGLVAAYGLVTYLHDERLARQSEIQRGLYENTADGSVILSNSHAREYFLDAIGPRRRIDSVELLTPDRPPEALLREIEAHIPNVYVFTAERTDKRGAHDAAPGALAAFVHERYAVQPVVALDLWPDRIRLERLTAKR